MKKIPGKQTPVWLHALKQLKINPGNLSLKELGAFRDLESFLTEPIPGPIPWQYLTRCFRYLTAFALTTVYMKTIPLLSRCWDDLVGKFVKSGVFNDGVFAESWIFCDFPCTPSGQTALDLFEEFVKPTGTLDAYRCVIDAMRSSRLGLYQEVLSSKTTIRFKELISEKTVEAFRSIDEFGKGEIFLTRLVPIEGEIFCFGDPKCWPKEYKARLEDMVRNKLYFFKGPTVEAQFETFMKLAGPYWMSCVMPDESFPILPPDYFQTFLESKRPS